MAIKYLAGERLQGTAAERAAMTTSSGGWITPDGDDVVFNETTKIITNGAVGSGSGNDRIYQQLSETLGNTFVITFEWTRTSSSGGSVHPLMVSSSTDAPRDDQGQDALGTYEDTNGNGMVITNGTHASSGNFSMAQNVKEYAVLRRVNVNAMDLIMYASDAYTGTAQHVSDFTISSAVSGLQYIMCANGLASGSLHTFSIDNIKVYNDTTSIPPSSGDKIFDSDTSGVVYAYPNLSNGTIFEESDTGKHYMWDGTDTWNEVT